MERCRYGERRQGSGKLVAIARIGQKPRLQHRLGQLFDEQGHAVGLGHDLPGDLVRQSLGSDHPVHHCRALAASESGERQRADVRLPRPRRLKLRPEGDQQKHWQVLDTLDREPQQLLRGRIDPVHVLVSQEYRLCRRKALQLIDQRLQRQLLLTLRRQFKRRATTLRRQAEQSCDQRYSLLQPVRAARQECLELGELPVGRIVTREAGGALQLLDQRMQGAGGVVRRALVEKRGMGLAF